VASTAETTAAATTTAATGANQRRPSRRRGEEGDSFPEPISTISGEYCHTPPPVRRVSQAAGLNAIAEGFRHMGYKDDHEINAAQWIVYDALYAYCQEMIRRGKPDGLFR